MYDEVVKAPSHAPHDWFWSFDENTLMNRSCITRFGITFAEVTIFMQKQSGQ